MRIARSEHAPMTAPVEVFATMRLAIASSASPELTAPSAPAPMSALDMVDALTGPAFVTKDSWESTAR